MSKKSIFLDPTALAMMPIAHLVGRTSPFERYRRESNELPGIFRDVVNSAVQAYQLHVYLMLVRRHFGLAVRQEVLDHQADILARADSSAEDIGHYLGLIGKALRREKEMTFRQPGEAGDPIEVGVARYLLQSIAAGPQELVRAPGRDRLSVPRAIVKRLSDYLEVGKEDVYELFLPLFEEFAHRDDA